MTIQYIPLTQANRRMKQIRQFMNNDGLVVLTSHDRPALIVLDVERCLRLLFAAEQLTQLMTAGNLVEAAQAISAANASGLSNDQQWTKHALNDLRQAEDTGIKIRNFERAPLG